MKRVFCKRISYAVFTTILLAIISFSMAISCSCGVGIFARLLIWGGMGRAGMPVPQEKIFF